MVSPFLYLPDERLSTAELSAARIDGHLIEVGDAYMPADAVETTALRAGSLIAILGTTLAATHLTAAWIHGALPDPPARHTVQRAVERRLHHVFGIRLVYRDLQIDRDDLMLVGGAWVSTPVRTLADLARVPDDAHARAVRLLAGDDLSLVDAATQWLAAHPKLPGRRAALSTLDGLAEAVRTT